MSTRPVIHWFRRDLRLTDNTALHHAARSGRPVVPVYVISPWKGGHSWTGPARQSFLCGCLESLGKNLASKGSRLIFRHGVAVEELLNLVRETKAVAVYANRDPDPFGAETERKLGAALLGMGVEWHLSKDAALHERDEVVTGAGAPYRVFTPYNRNWQSLPKAALLPRIDLSPAGLDLASEPSPSLKTWGLGAAPAGLMPAGEAAARQRLREFLQGPLFHYAARRNIPAGVTTSQLSADLRHGTISIREIYHAVVARMSEAESADAKKSCGIYLNELAWREFYMQILHHFPEVLIEEFAPNMRGLAWSWDADKFAQWRDGQTGFPIIDAGMRQLAATGFMHNRVRMITAMFLTKDLRIDWRMGEQYFMSALIDGEIASNNGGWQWSAGTGADAAPYFRIQNPWTQSSVHDPEGHYIKQWVPELRDVPAQRFLAPPTAGRLAPGYPVPMVDHAVEREKTLAFFKISRAGNSPLGE